MSKPITGATQLDAADVFSTWSTRRTCGELDGRQGVFLHYELMCGDFPVVEFFPKYEDLTVDDLPHLVDQLLCYDG